MAGIFVCPGGPRVKFSKDPAVVLLLAHGRNSLSTGRAPPIRHGGAERAAAAVPPAGVSSGELRRRALPSPAIRGPGPGRARSRFVF